MSFTRRYAIPIGSTVGISLLVDSFAKYSTGGNVKEKITEIIVLEKSLEKTITKLMPKVNSNAKTKLKDSRFSINLARRETTPILRNAEKLETIVGYFQKNSIMGIVPTGIQSEGYLGFGIAGQITMAYLGGALLVSYVTHSNKVGLIGTGMCWGLYGVAAVGAYYIKDGLNLYIKIPGVKSIIKDQSKLISAKNKKIYNNITKAKHEIMDARTPIKKAMKVGPEGEIRQEIYVPYRNIMSRYKKLQTQTKTSHDVFDRVAKSMNKPGFGLIESLLFAVPLAAFVGYMALTRK